MATPNSSYSDILTTTIGKRSRALADNVSNNTALLMRLRQRNNNRPFSGGATLDEEIAFSGPGNSGWYSGFDTLDTSQGDMLTVASYNIKQIAVAISISGLEMIQNAGPERFIDLAGGRMRTAEWELMNTISTGVYSAGTAAGGKQLGGLQLLVSDDSTGTVGGINAGTYSFWANQYYDFSDNSVTAGASTIQTAMNTLYFDCVRNNDAPDLIPADNTYYGYYLESLQANQRFTNASLAEAGFVNVKFMNADVVLDGGLNGAAASAHMYFLNTRYLHFRTHSARDFVPLNPERYAVNQDAVVKFIAWAGNMTTSSRRLQGVIVA